MIEVKLIPDTVSFGYKIVFLKDGEKLSSFNYELLGDLTFVSPANNPFKGPELLKNDLMFELATMVVNDNLEELKDVSLDEIIDLFRPIVENYKIKSWDGKHLPFY